MSQLIKSYHSIKMVPAKHGKNCLTACRKPKEVINSQSLHVSTDQSYHSIKMVPAKHGKNCLTACRKPKEVINSQRGLKINPLLNIELIVNVGKKPFYLGELDILVEMHLDFCEVIVGNIGGPNGLTKEKEMLKWKEISHCMDVSV